MSHIIQGLFLYRPIFRQYIRRFLLESVDDGIAYVEPRIDFVPKYDFSLFFSIPGCSMVLRYMFDADGIQNVPHREWLLDFKQAIDDVRSVLKEQCRGDEFIGAKVSEWTRYHGTWVTGMTTTDHIHYYP